MTTEDIQQGASVTSLREELLRRRLSGRRRAQRPGIAPADRDAPLPLSYGQQQMWFLNRLEPESAEYSVPLAFRLSGALDRDALTRALSEIVARHEILRTRYRLGDSEPVQVIDAPVDVDVAVTDLTGVPEDERAARCHAVLSEEARRPFDLETQRPLRARLVALAADEHVLAVVFHHIAFDAWSTRVFAREFGDLYSAFALGVPSTLPDLAVQYADFATWQRTEVPEREMERHLDYWRQQLADLPVVDLPGDRARPAVRSHAGEAVPFTLSRAVAERVRSLAAAHDATPFVVLLAAFQLLVGRYTGTADVPVGTVVSGRTLPELQGLIGYGINNLVMRSRWDGRDTFSALVSQVRDVLITAYDHQAVPFARLADELQPERDMSRTPLYQVAITMHEPRDQVFALPGLRAQAYPITGRVAKVDLELQVGEAGDDGLAGQLVYAEAIFDRSTAERMARHYVRLLEQALAEPGRAVADIEVMDAAERAVVLGPEPAVLPVTRTLQELFEERVRVAPDAVAVVAGGLRLSYREVNERANRVAWRLRGLGVGPESLVAVCLPRGADLIPVLLGVLKAGAGYLPLDPAHPVERLAFVLGDAGAAVLVASSEVVVPSFAGVTVLVDSDAELGGLPVADPPVVSGPDNVVYVIYTSGSTGRPKGVVLSQANVVRLLSSAQEHFAFDDADVWSLTHSYAFDVSVFEMWGALAHGGTVVVVPADVARAPEEFSALLRDERVTVLSQTPSAFRALLGTLPEGDPDLPALRAVVFAGEKLEMAELRSWAATVGVDRPHLVNMYGITETTVHTTYHRLSRQDIVSGSGNPIGRPLSDLRIHLLDAYGALVPVGVVGEICVGGPGLARGYLNQPGLTAQRFVPDPFGSGQRLYRSGDLARRRADGSLDFVGRVDDQVKIRGFRVELGEIEAVLSAQAGVREAVVLLRADRLVAYLVSDGPVEVAGFREVLGRDLPEYMVPAAFVVLEALPLTANGKLDKRALPAPRDDAYGTAGAVAPRNPMEERIAAVWSEVLGVDRVGVHDSFFDLGGDSIRAVALVGALKAEGFDLTVRDVFDRRTVAEVGDLLAGRSTLDAGADRLVRPFELIGAEDRAALPEGVVDAYPLSRIQTGMVIEMLADDRQNNYHNSSAFRIRDEDPFDAEAFRRAAAWLVDRHEMLRTSVHLTGFSVPMQLVHASAAVTTGVFDHGVLDETAEQRVLHEFAVAQRADPFDLTRPTLMRFFVHLTGPGAWWISITECHPVMEGWSYHSMLMELVQAYQRLRAGLAPDAPELPAVRFADAIAGELAALASPESREHWQHVAGDYQKFTLPRGWGDTSATERTTYHARISWADLEPDLRALAARARASLKSVMLAAYTKVLSSLTEEQSVHAGLVYDTRPEILGADRVFGMYLNTLPFPMDPVRGTWLDLVRHTFTREVESWGHRRYPLPAVQRDLGGSGLIEVFFNYQDFRQVDTEVVDASRGMDDSPTEFPLTISSRAKHIFLTSDTRSLSRANTDRIAGMFRTVLAAMAADPDGDARLPLVTLAERDDLLEWAVNPAGPARFRSVPRMLEEQVHRHPGATAVVAGDTTLTFAELDARAARYAEHFTARGVRPGSIVAVLLDRGPDLLPVLWGVWRAGAAYLPLDPAFPADRVAQMAGDADVALLVTESAFAGAARGVDADRLVLVDADRSHIDALRPAAAPVPADPDALAYVIYTSGSTGRPKGVAVPHRGLANHVRWAAEVLAPRGTGGAPLFSSIAFDLVVPNLWAAVAAGQPVHMVPAAVDLADLGAYLTRSAPYSFIKLTPGHLEVLTHQLAAEQADRLAGVLVVAGEALTRRVVEAWRALAPSVELINEYGPTEASVGTCVLPVPATVAEVVPIGRPLPDMEMHVLDEFLQHVPVGVTGELYVGGTGVARGYLNRPELTADRFVPHPYGPPGARLYRTGDLVRVLPGGIVDFQGRRDDQVKIRGYRVELGEIETALATVDGLIDVRVVARADQLVAYLVTQSTVDPVVLRERLSRTLPEYMVPAAYVTLDEIPLTANGKLDRRALPDPDAGDRAAAAFEAARTPLEERVAGVWRDVLGVERVGVHDDFFELGGDSIRAVALIGALRAEGWDVSVREVLENRTVDAVCRLLSGRAALTDEDRRTVPPFAQVSAADRALLPAGVTDAYPLSMNQSGMLLETIVGGEERNYHNVNMYDVKDDALFDAAAFEQAVRTVVQRHEVLRTTMHLTGFSVPMQLVHERADIPCTSRDLRGVEPRDQFTDISAFVAAERENVFDPAAGRPLLRVHAHVTSDAGWVCGFTQHHAVMDGWSNQLLLMELIEVYRHLRDGRPVPAAEAASVRFADTIAAERRALDSEQTRAYWSGVLAEHTKMTMPAGWHGDLSAPAVAVRAGMSFADLEDGLRRLATAAKASIKTVLVAAHLKVMSQLTDAEALHTGLVTHTRLAERGGDRVLGTFLNTVPFPARTGARTWRDLVRQVSDTEIEVWEHRHFPMPAMGRAQGSARLVDVFFCYLDFHRMDTEVADDSQGFNDAPNEFAVGIVALNGLLSLRSNTHVLDAPQAQRLTGMFRLVLEAMAADPDGDARKAYVPATAAVAAPARPRPRARGLLPKCPHELFEEQAARTPSAVAVVADGRELTYAQVNAEANRIAHHLRSLGAGPETLVGVCLPRGADLVPALLGVLKSGAGYVPLDPADPAQRLAGLATGTARLVITGPSGQEALAAVPGLRLVTLDEVRGLPATDPPRVADPDATMYVIHTSGSTGRPKGCVVTHRGVLRLLAAHRQAYEYDEFDVWAMVHSPAFDGSVLEMWGALLHGGRIVVVPHEVAGSPEDLLDMLVRHRVTVLDTTPLSFRALALAAADDPRAGRLSLRLVSVGGERVEPDHLRPWVQRHGVDEPALIVAYGITETTVDSTHHLVAEEDLDGTTIPIGVPLQGQRVHVLDRYGEPVPDGVNGEIHIGGSGVARGYLDRPELTAERFVPDPFGRPGSRLYRTGDLGRRRPDGVLEFAGRIDDQVKIRGYRIEPAEITACLNRHPAVREAVVVVREDTPGDRCLVAYWVPENGTEPDPDRLAEHCAAALPAYLVPSAFVPLPAIPVTLNRKLDVAALPPPELAAPAAPAPAAPRTPLEDRIAAVWRDVLRRPVVGRDDAFFDIGGDSMRAIAVVGALRDSGLDVSVKDLFRHPSVAGLGELLAGRGGTAATVEPVRPFALIDEADRERMPADAVDAYPMSQVQTGMVVEMLTGSATYRSFGARELHSPASEEALRAAAADVAERHELLRTSLHLHGFGTPMQVVHAAAQPVVTVHDLRGVPAGERRAALLTALAVERDAPHDLERASLLHAGAIIEDDGHWWLTLSLPHAVTEGWSFAALQEELLGCYRTRIAGGTPEPVTAPALRYADFIAAELRSLASAEDTAHWQRVVQAASPVRLPETWADPEDERFQHLVDLSDLEPRLRALATELRVSVKTVLLAAHGAVMARISEVRQAHVGLVCDARPEELGADQVFGMHLNTVPFRLDRTAPTWRELVRRVFDQEVELWPHRRFPMPAIQRLGDGGRLVHVAFNYVDLPAAQRAGEPAGTRVSESHTEFDLTLHCRPDRLNLTTRTGVLGRRAAERLAQMYRSVLEAMTADPDGDARAAHLPAEDEAALPAAPPAAVPSGVDVPAELARWARETPDAVALASGAETTTYRELDHETNRLARALRGRGVGRGAVVGLVLPSSPELVTAVVAVLKAGAAALPIDPRTPQERIDFLLADAEVTEVLDAAAMGRRDWAAESDGPLVTGAIPADVAFVLYTSGSTGRPKGVLIPRGGMGNHLLAKIEDLGLTAADTLVHNAPPTFVVAIWQMLAPLVTGGRILVVGAETAQDPRRLFETVAREGATVLEVVPSLLRAALEDPATVPALPGLRRLVVTGEAVPADLIRRWFARFPQVGVLNSYGQTECSDDVAHAALDAGRRPDPVPIGRPVRGTRLHVLDERLTPVPHGVPGELYVGGPGVGHGYLGRPELTAERFVPDPWGRPGARLYRTGDLGRVRPDGELDYLGRLDHQIKVRGQRVEPGEIEAFLTTLPGIRQAVVILRDQRLVAYVVAAEGTRPAPAELREAAFRALPEHLVPAAFLVLDRIPLSPNGKLDRRALPEPGDEALARAAYSAPGTAAEERIAELYRQALGVRSVGRDDSFFDLGGDSLRAVTLVGGLRAAGYDATVHDVFEARTVARLGALLAERSAPVDAEPVAPFALIGAEDRAALPVDAVDAYPLGRTQLGMAIEATAGDGRGAYHMITSFRVTDGGPLDPAALRRAAAVLADRHETLRTSVHLTGFSVPMQVVHARAEIPVEVHDIRGRTDEEIRAVRDELVAGERSRPFDMATGPLLRIVAHAESDDAWWLTLTQSHAMTEGWSTHVVLMELLDCHRRLRAGEELAPYDRPGVRFADAIAAELRALSSADHREYWRSVTSGHTPVRLPAGWAGDSDRRVFLQVPFDDLEDDLRRLATVAGASLKSVLLAAHLKVMGQLTDAPAYHTGMVCDTRPELLGADRVPGMYLNTLPIGVDRSARTWRDLVAQVFRRQTDLWAHRRYPLAAVQQEAGPDRLVDVFFNHLDFHQVDTAMVAAGTRATNAPNEFALSVISQGGRLHLSTAERHLSRAAAERIASMLRAVLEAMAAGPDGDARATYLPAGERSFVLGAEPAVVPVTRTLQELFEERVRLAPDAVAVVAGGHRLSYREVNERANRVAWRLRGLGVGAESLVAVCLPRGADLIPVLLGVLKAGAGYLPLDPAHPVERLAFVLGDAGAAVLVASSEVVVPSFAGTTVLIDSDAELEGLPVVDPPVVSGPDNVVYVIYTSGSTGRPKGVVLSQANVVRLLSSAQEHFAFDDADVWSLTHSYAFDVSVFEMWGALAHGGTVVVVPQEVSRSPEDLISLLATERVTVLSQTPSAFKALAPVAAGDPRPLSLRAVVFAGERLEPADLRAWADRHPVNRVALVNMYGITETTVHTTYHRLSRQDITSGLGNPIGRPLSDLRIHLLDAYGALVPVGVVGEICVGGPGLARGYLNQPELTAQRFVPDPFGSGQRLYRSGDLARRRADGSLDFVGRVDDQVKIRGFRVELGEIQAVLSAQAAVREAVVLLRADRLVAYLVTDAPVDVAELRDVLSRDLPEYMVPAAFVVLDALPLTANGKLDKRALPAPGDDAYGRTAHVPAATPAEQLVATVWRDVLGVARIGATDGFFDLGGDSIKAVTIAGRLRDAGHRVTARDVLAHRTVRELAAAASDGTAAFTPVAPFALIDPRDRALVPDGATDAYPLTQSQLGMLVEMLATDGPASYHRVATARVGADEPFSREALRRALDELTRRHEALRTSVDLTTYRVPVQVVHAAAEIPLVVTDLSHATEEEQGRVLRAAVREESTTVLSHDRAPLLRVRVHLLPGGAWLVTITQSHLIIDGWTFSRLRADLLEIYRAVRDGRDLPADEPPQVRFADTVAAELRALESAREREYWRELVNGRPRFVLPEGMGDRTGAPQPYRVSVSFDDLLDRLRAVAAEAGTPLKSVLLAAHLAVLRRYSPQRRFHTGLVVHCRPEAAGAENVYGSHLNTVPFPVEPAAPTWADEARDVFGRELEIWPHRDFPMPAMQLELADGGRLVHGFFSYEDFEGPRAPLAETGDGGFSHSEFSFAVTAGEGLLVVETGTEHLSRDHGERLAGMYRAVLESVAANGSPRDAHLAAGEAEWLLRQAVVPAGPVSRSVTAAFEDHAARTPAAPAVVTDDEVWTYADLEARANRIAHHLRSLGVGPESRVAVLLRRGPDLVAALLGAWKAGAAYVPLDPANPPQRLVTLLRVADPAVVLTESALEHVVTADPDLARRGVMLDRSAAALAAVPADPPRRAEDLDTLAYVIFTSGSTGLPKGVQISHRALANYQRSAVEQYFGERRGGTPLFCSISFDVSATSLHLALSAGLPVHLAPQDLDLSRLGAWLLAHGPFTLIDITPSLLDVLAGQLTDEQFDGLTAKLALGGEEMRGATATRLHTALGDGRVVNSYGPTEVTVACVEHVLHGWAGGETVPIGRPYAATSAHVLDEHLGQVPAGVPGELCLGGDSVARGYLGQPALTAERFVPDPYGAPGGRLYRSGDLARVLPDGTLDFLGRLDQQVKIRGNRVELGEIESQLAAHPAVADVRASLTGDRLVAYLVAAGPDRPSGLELRELLAARLPDYMVPAAYVWLPAIPLTGNGKLDRSRLPEAGGDAVAHRPYAAPASDAEERLARVFAAVLDLERAGRDDRFFELGGNSILVFQLISAAAEEGLALSLVQVYADDRLHAIAASANPARRPQAPVARTGRAGGEAPVVTGTVPGLSLAVLRDGDVVEVRGEGVLRAGGGDAVTADTIFQAGSLSKHVTAFAVLRLADRGVVDLDTDVGAYLRSWTRLEGRGVTLRHLLAHLSGLAPTPAPGYPRDGDLPAVLDLLTGRGALSRAAAEPEVEPGRLFRKANTHYWVVEQLLTDVTGRPFADLVDELVFEPVGMRHSSVRQDFPERYAGPVACGHDAQGDPLPGDWLRWPDAAAGGLWTTATDLARLTLEIRRGYLGRPLALLSQDAAREMLTVQQRYSGYGLGTVVDDAPAGLGFGHGGSADGYHAVTLCRVAAGSGFVVLTNSDDGAAVAKNLLTTLDQEASA